MKSGLSAYEVVRNMAVDFYNECDCTKVLKHNWTIFIQEKENGLHDVILYLSAHFRYANNHTNYAKTNRQFETFISKDCNKIGAEFLAGHAQKEIESNTIQNVEIRFLKYEELEMI
jgi:hypothetical protein